MEAFSVKHVSDSLIAGMAKYRASRRAGSMGQQGQRLRLLTYNIQTGITTQRYRHYLTHSWKHVLPTSDRVRNLDRIANVLRNHDIVGLQEVDAGSLRSGFINQTEYLAIKAHFPYWYQQTNRDLGKIAQHSLGILSKHKSNFINECKLPGVIPGRGAMMVEFGEGDDTLLVAIVHLALGKRTRMRQLAFLSELFSDYRHVIMMGDLNCQSESREMEWLMENSNLCLPVRGLHTFPSWRPFKSIDHILVSPTLEVGEANVLSHVYSDHLPISMEVSLPEGLALPGH